MDFIPFLHLLLHVDALLLQKLSLSKGPIYWLHRRFSSWRLLPFSSGLFWVVEPEHVVLSHNDTVTWRKMGNKRGEHEISRADRRVFLHLSCLVYFNGTMVHFVR